MPMRRIAGLTLLTALLCTPSLLHAEDGPELFAPDMKVKTSRLNEWTRLRKSEKNSAARPARNADMEYMLPSRRADTPSEKPVVTTETRYTSIREWTRPDEDGAAGAIPRHRAPQQRRAEEACAVKSAPALQPPSFLRTAKQEEPSENAISRVRSESAPAPKDAEPIAPAPMRERPARRATPKHPMPHMDIRAVQNARDTAERAVALLSAREFEVTEEIGRTVPAETPRPPEGYSLGNSAPDFILTSHTGDPVRLSDLRGRSGVVLVFFATWCSPCMAEVPQVKEFAASVQGQPIRVYGVNRKQSLDTIQKFMRSRNVNYPVLVDKDLSVFKRLNVSAIPTVIGIDADGVIRHRGHMPHDTAALAGTLTAPLSRTTVSRQPVAIDRVAITELGLQRF